MTGKEEVRGDEIRSAARYRKVERKKDELTLILERPESMVQTFGLGSDVDLREREG